MDKAQSFAMQYGYYDKGKKKACCVGYNAGYKRAEKDLALTWEDIAIILSIYEAGVDNGDYSRYGDSGKMKEYSQDVLKRFSQIKEKMK